MGRKGNYRYHCTYQRTCSARKIQMIYVEQEDCTIKSDYMTREIAVYRKPGQYNIENDRYVQENIIEKVLVNTQEPLKRELSTFLEGTARSREIRNVLPKTQMTDMHIRFKIKDSR